MKKTQVVGGVKTQAIWWLSQRLRKVRAERHGSMEVNPFMAPLVAALHGHASFDEIAEFLLGAHFAIGHATGFGKLVDEKILPLVFNSQKLDKALRATKPLNLACFDNVDHIVVKPSETVLLSQKASKWTIQLGQAVELNRSFHELLNMRANGQYSFDRIVVATFYGKKENLSDKYRILRGINTGASHSVIDISASVDILAGKQFWSWIGDDADTQQWVMQGIVEAIHDKASDLKEVVSELNSFKKSFSKKFEKSVVGGQLDWQRLLLTINGE